MNLRMTLSAAGAAVLVGGSMVMFSPSGVEAQQGVPAAAPRPTNPQPSPANSQPPTATPGTVQPQPVPNRPTTPPGGPGASATGTGRARYERPFAFQSPGVEARFVDSSRRLVAMESRMNLSNQALLKRLGEVRTMPPEKQNAALADVIQQMLLDQGQMQKYLVQARTAWTGEVEGLPAEMPEETIPTPTPADAPTGAPTTPQNAPR
jgi:hypothetical protein